MAKLISANKLNRFWKNGVMLKTVLKTNVLKSMEEITANTNAENVAGALAVKELNNNLVSNIYVGADGKLHKVQGGADTVLPFSAGNYHVQITCLMYGGDSGNSSSASYPENPRGQIIQNFEFDISNGAVSNLSTTSLKSSEWDAYGTWMCAHCRIQSIKITKM